MLNKRGFMLVFALVIIMLVVLSLAALFLISYSDLGMAVTESKGMKAYYIAEAGLAKKFMDLRAGDNISITSPVTFTLGDGSSGTFSVAVNQISLVPFPSYTLTSTGTYANVTRIVSLTLKQVSYSTYGYLSNSEDSFYWGSPIWFVTGDILSGPLHTNDQLNISGNPVFKGPVTSAQNTINYNQSVQNDPDFQDSLTLGVSPVAMPSTADIITPIQTAASKTDGMNLTGGDKQIVLKSTGKMDIYKKKNGNWVSQSSNVSLPANNAIFVPDGDLYISGTLNGQLTAGTGHELYITDSILYNTNPRTNPNSTDLLSLVAQNNVHVMNNISRTDVEIDAYIIAAGTPPQYAGSFGVDNYDTIPVKGNLTVYGGISQNTRGGVGTFNSTTNQKTSGYTKDYNYDTRLVNSVPLYFPAAKDSTGRYIYKKVSWSET